MASPYQQDVSENDRFTEDATVGETWPANDPVLI